MHYFEQDSLNECLNPCRSLRPKSDLLEYSIEFRRGPLQVTPHFQDSGLEDKRVDFGGGLFRRVVMLDVNVVILYIFET